MIYLPPPQPVLNKDVCIGGEVEIHPTASLAQGVILQSAPNCRIVIGADVCIGMGAIINAVGGEINIENGAILGSGVLIIGSCTIGKNACIGTSSTIFQSNVEEMAVISPGSIIGDDSRQLEPAKAASQSSQSEHSKQSKQPAESQAQNSFSKDQKKNKKRKKHRYQTAGGYGFASQSSPASAQGFRPNSNPNNNNFNNNSPHHNSPTPPQAAEPQIPTDPLAKSERLPVVGQVYLNELLITLFPHRQSTNHIDNKSDK